jgi:hypothetical protein
MSQWRKIALEQVPTCKRAIELSGNPMALWIELLSQLTTALNTSPADEEVIDQIYSYALWCWHRSDSGQMIQAVSCAFIEHLPLSTLVERDLPARLSREDFSSMEGVFRYHLSDEEFDAFKVRFMSANPKRKRAWMPGN